MMIIPNFVSKVFLIEDIFNCCFHRNDDSTGNTFCQRFACSAGAKRRAECRFISPDEDLEKEFSLNPSVLTEIGSLRVPW